MFICNQLKTDKAFPQISNAKCNYEIDQRCEVIFYQDDEKKC